MRIDEAYRECVCFLCVDARDGDILHKKECATGFFVAVPIDSQYGTVYLVTARHVLEESRALGPLFAKINLASGGVQYVPVPQESWSSHESTDVALIRFSKVKDGRYLPLLLSVLADDNYLSSLPVEPGDEIFSIGLFKAYSGEEQAEPIARCGHVALGLKRIPVKLNSATSPAKVDAYLIETKSWGGESGSPVFHCKWPNSPMMQISSTSPGMIGLLQGHFDLTAKTTKEDTLGVNSGIGIVIPAKAIRDLLNYPSVLQWRVDQKQKIDAGVIFPEPNSD
jgi:Trypsin-like peptidase domain